MHPPAPTLVVDRSCRACHGPLDLVTDLGTLKVSTFPLPTDGPTLAAPLRLSRCHHCTLVQLAQSVSADFLYRYQYWYRSSVNEVMRLELADVVADAVARVTFEPNDVVIDIGANDGYLLSRYAGVFSDREQVLRVAYEPAASLRMALRDHCEVLVPNFFSDQPARREIVGLAKVITAIAMLYDVDDLGPFFQALATALHPDGVIVLQFQDLAQMIATTAFDNICHEHLTYLSLRAVDEIAAQVGLRIVDAVRRPINGGSLRVILQHQRLGAIEEEPRVGALLAAEKGCEDWETLERFSWRITEAVTQIHAAIDGMRDLPIDLYAASTKANTLLQVCGLDETVLRCAWERSPEKWGRMTVTGIPIVSEADGRKDPPAALLLGAWQFKGAFVQREASFLDAGGVMIVPLPAVEIVAQRFGRRRNEADSDGSTP